MAKIVFAEVSAMLEERGLMMRQGTIVAATIIAAPPSTIGVEVASGVVHTLTGTAANEADINQMAAVLHGQERAVFADAGYAGAAKRPEHADRKVSWNIAVKRSIIKALPERLRDWAQAVETALSRVRAWVEHPFHIVKNLFRHKKLRTAAWPRTPRNGTPCLPSPIW